MKVIIAGGRDYKLNADDYAALDKFDITEVISGGCLGADTSGEYYATHRGVPVKRFLPDWKGQGRAAGPLRNKKMAEYADMVALFPGGRGTDSMYREAIHAGIMIADYRGLPITKHDPRSIKL